jgi:hypothetical protein
MTADPYDELDEKSDERTHGLGLGRTADGRMPNRQNEPNATSRIINPFFTWI